MKAKLKRPSTKPKTRKAKPRTHTTKRAKLKKLRNSLISEPPMPGILNG
jgi:hypothetical protein